MNKANMHPNSGFTLVELAIVLAMAALTLFAMVNAYTTIAKRASMARTDLNLSLIRDALAAYAERNMRLPCPMNASFTTMAEPFGTENGSGVDGGLIPADCPLLEGVIPFKTLGLEPDIVKDGFGHLFTYRIARSHGRDPSIATDIHDHCRSDSWITINMAGDTINKDPEFARFCCRAPEGGNDDIDVQYRLDLAAPLQPILPRPVDDDAARYDTEDNAGPARADYISYNIERPIYIVMSHGEQGIGAFRNDGSGARIIGFSGNDEAQNFDIISGQFILAPTVKTQNNVNFFDDHIIWETQDSILRHTGRKSCAAP